MKRTLILVALFGFYACGARKAVNLEQKQIDKVIHLYPDYTLAALQEGRTAFETHCKTCHPIKDPASKTEAEWKVTVPRMVEKANKKVIKIQPETQESIERYLVTMSKSYK